MRVFNQGTKNQILFLFGVLVQFLLGHVSNESHHPLDVASVIQARYECAGEPCLHVGVSRGAMLERRGNPLSPQCLLRESDQSLPLRPENFPQWPPQSIVGSNPATPFHDWIPDLKDKVFIGNKAAFTGALQNFSLESE